MAKKPDIGKGGLFGGIAANLHIKKNTAGTSNELSLSVLDGLKSQADEGAPPAFGPAAPVEKGSGSPRRQRKAKAALPPARARALEDPEGEIRRRKTARRARRIVFALAAFAIIAAGVGYGALKIVDAHEYNESNLSLLRQGLAELEAADETVLAADAEMTGGAEDIDANRIAEIQAEMDDAEVRLKSAESFANSARDRLGEGDARKAADQVAAAVEARRTMLSEASAVMDAEVSAQKAVDLVEQAWDAVLEADGLVKEAAALVSNTTEENTRASQEKSEQARALLAQASQNLADAQTAYPADLSALEGYIAKRDESIGYAIASDEAIYLQDRATAESNNDAYNSADAEAAKLAALLPANPAQPVLDALEENTSASRQRYAEARTSAATADAFIRDYLGNEG